MPDEAILRAKAREAVQQGKLPARRADRTWGGPGAGDICSVCAEPIKKDQMEHQIEFARDDDNAGVDKFHVHVRCGAAWEFERKNAGEAPR
jgi:hypothetical protein